MIGMFKLITLSVTLAAALAPSAFAQRQGDGTQDAAPTIRAIHRCMARLGYEAQGSIGTRDQHRATTDRFDVAFQLDARGALWLDSIRLTSKDDADRSREQMMEQALKRCIARRMPDLAAPDGDRTGLRSYVQPVDLVRDADRKSSSPGVAVSRRIRDDADLVIGSLLVLTMPAIGALPFAVANR